MPNQEATISQSQIAVTEAPVGAISEPIIAEGFAGGFIAAPLGAAALVGAAVAAGAIGGATTRADQPPFFVSPVSP